MKNHNILITLWTIISIIGALLSFSATYVNQIIGGSNPLKGLVSNLLLILFILVIGQLFFVRRKANFYQQEKKLAPYIFIFSLICLVIVPLLGENAEVNNAMMYIPIGPFNFQPLELFKIGTILYLATYLPKISPNDSFNRLCKTSFWVVVGVLLLVIQPDIGGAIILVLLFGVIILVNGQFQKEIIYMTIAGSGFIIFFVTFILDGYQKARITNWLNPFNDAKDGGYQLIQSFIAISNGGVSGSGYMNSIQKAGFLTQPGSDFIFSIILEETGIFGAISILGFLFALAYCLIKIGNSAHERFGMLYCYGMASLIIIQTFINTGGVVGVIPMTGVTLPFISEGINSYLFMTLGVFLAIPISRESLKVKKNEKKLKASTQSN